MRETTNNVRQVTVYGGEGCHLCDVAQELLHQAQDTLREQRGLELTVHYVDVRRDKGLMIQYGQRIPVLACDEVLDGVARTKLCWPFDHDALLAWLA